MRILALDTATANCSAAVLLDGRLITREKLLERGGHAGHILPMADEVLAEAGVALAALSAIAFGRGPGAFTGVRLAAAVTQGLAFGAGLPVVPVSDLRALAQRVFEGDPAVARVVACADARMQEVYWGCFERGAGLAAPVGDEHVSSPASVILPAAWVAGKAQAHVLAPEASRAIPARQVCGAGSGFAAYRELRARLADALDSIREELLPRAAEVALLAAPEVAAGRVFPPEQALPVYLREDVVRGPHAQSLN